MSTEEVLRSAARTSLDILLEESAMGEYVKMAMDAYPRCKQFLTTVVDKKLGDGALARTLASEKFKKLDPAKCIPSLSRKKQLRYVDSMRLAMSVFSFASSVVATEVPTHTHRAEPIVASEAFERTPAPAQEAQVVQNSESDDSAEVSTQDGQDTPPDEQKDDADDTTGDETEEEDDDDEDEDPIITQVRSINKSFCSALGVEYDKEDPQANLTPAEETAFRILVGNILNPAGNDIGDKWKNTDFKSDLREVCGIHSEEDDFAPFWHLQNANEENKDDTLFTFKCSLATLLLLQDSDTMSAIQTLRTSISDQNVFFEYDILELHTDFSKFLHAIADKPTLLAEVAADAEATKLIERLSLGTVFAEFAGMVSTVAPADRNELIRTTATSMVGSSEIKQAIDTIMSSKAWSYEGIANQMYPYMKEGEHTYGAHVPLDIPEKLGGPAQA